MIKLKNILLKNFLSVGNVTQAVNLEESGLTLVLGSNSDSNGTTTRNGAGKAQPLSAKVLTHFGWREMRDVKVGTIVQTPSGDYARVSGVFPQGRLPIYKLTFTDGRTTEACGEHLWKVWARSGDWKWSTISTHEMIERTKKGGAGARIYVPLIENDTKPDVSLPMDPRLLGILIGDGYMKGLCFSSADEEIVKYVIDNTPDEYKLLKTGYDYRITRGKGKKGHDCYLRDVLKYLKLTNTKSDNKFIPREYFNASYAQRVALLTGLMDTDGHVGKNGELSYSTASKQLADDVSVLVRSIGGLSKMTQRVCHYTYNGVKKEGKVSYTIRIRHRDPRSLVCLTRKLDRISLDYQYKDCLRLEVKSIECIGEQEAQCIMVDHPDHLYITDDYIVTHNTTVLQAISYALYGEPLTKIKVDNLINNVNQRGMLVTLDFERDGIKYRIERGRKPNILKFYKNDDEIIDESKGENKETKIDIMNIFGMTHEMFELIVALNTNTEPFLKQRAADQRAIIEELLGVTQISTRADTLKKLITETKNQITREAARVDATVEANSRIGVAVEGARSKGLVWTKTQSTILTNLQEEIDAASSIAFDDELAIFDQIEAWDAAKSDLAAATSMLQRELDLVTTSLRNVRDERSRAERRLNGEHDATIARLATEITRKIAAIDLSRLEQDRLDGAIAEKDKELADPGELDCKTCGQQLSGTDHLTYVVRRLTEDRQALFDRHEKGEQLLSKQQDELTHLQEEKDKITKEAAEAVITAEKEIAECDLQITQLEQAQVEKQALWQASDDAERNLVPRPTSLFSARSEIYALRSAQELLVAELDNEKRKVNPYEDQVTNLESTLQEVSYDYLEETHDLLKHQDFVFRMLTGKDSFIRKKIIEQNLHYLNLRMNGYLDKLGLPHEVCFISDLSVEIVLLGREMDFAQLSRGEMNRVILATSWAFRDVWESLNHPVNLLFIDELGDSGTDQAGAEAMLNILKSFGRDRAKSVFLISHRDELVGRIDRTLTANKENGFTTFEKV